VEQVGTSYPIEIPGGDILCSSTDIAVVHNFTEQPGGEDLAEQDIIEVFLDRGHTVNLYTSQPEGVRRIALYLGRSPESFNELRIKIVEIPRAIKHPYNIYVITKNVFRGLKQHYLTIFFGDIPKSARELMKVLAYVHYPHAA